MRGCFKVTRVQYFYLQEYDIFKSVKIQYTENGKEQFSFQLKIEKD